MTQRPWPVVLLCALLAVPLPRGAAAQEPERPDSARGDVAPAVPAAPAPTARLTPPPRIGLSLTVGTLGFSDLQTQPVRGDRGAMDGEPALWLRRSIAASGGYHVQGSALVSLGPAWAVRIGGGIGRADLEIVYSGVPDEALEEVRGLPAVSGGRLELQSLEAALRFRIPAFRRFAPYAELGGAREWWSLGDDQGLVIAGGEALLEPFSRTAVQLGAGATFPLTGWLDGRVQATMGYARTPFTPGTPGTPIAGGDSLRLTLAAPEAAPFADGTIEMTRILRLEAGLTLRLGTVPEEPRSRPAGSADAPSGTRR